MQGFVRADKLFQEVWRTIRVNRLSGDEKDGILPYVSVEYKTETENSSNSIKLNDIAESVEIDIRRHPVLQSTSLRLVMKTISGSEFIVDFSNSLAEAILKACGHKEIQEIVAVSNCDHKVPADVEHESGRESDGRAIKI